MASPTTIYLSSQQRKRLFTRARRRKTSFSQELRSAVDLYLGLPPDFGPDALTVLARQANDSLDRSIRTLDGAISRVMRSIQRLDQIDRRLDELA